MAGNMKNTPTETKLKEFCNLGYAKQCERLPADRKADSIRFSVSPADKSAKDRIRLHYSCERNHAPVEHGVLDYNCETRTWQVQHTDPCIHRQAECYLETYLERRRIG